MYNDIMEADDASNKRLFYSLVNRQRRGGRTSLRRLAVDDVHLTSEEAIREGWAFYFQRLATPEEKEHYNIENRKQVDLDFDLICDICSRVQDTPHPQR